MTSLRDCVGPYRLLEEIGVGGMGEVYLALDSGGRALAVKVLHPVIARDAVARRRLEREVTTMRRVQSPYVAEVLDADFAARRPYIVTRYVQGRSLDERVRAGGPLRGPAFPGVARGLARALHAIHTAGIVHRDLKPANVVMVDDHPVVIDFGLAHVLDATRLTRTGTAIGTPGYLAPEILDGARAGPAADVFSWGATVVFAATGRSPYGSGPAQAVFSRVLRGRFELDGVPDDLLPMVEAALDLDPARRPGTGALLETLAARGRTQSAPAR
ncbi:MAG: serine/threonine protein kinase, partial [Actinoallomurus sp.]|nr:serine/threonine protein kinase [Actinoallomurus sp.]